MRKIIVTTTFTIAEDDMTKKEEAEVAKEVIQEMDMAADEVTRMYPVTVSTTSTQEVGTD